MVPLNDLGNTGMTVAGLSLGTVKFGRTAGVRYPTAAKMPTDDEARELLATAKALGINLIDTAPAYGIAEERLGGLLHDQRNDWLICTKVGEEFDGARSTFDFTPEHCRISVERSLGRLRTDRLDIVLIHSDGNDVNIIERYGTLAALKALKEEGKIRAIGMSHKSIAGAEHALNAGADVLMATLNREFTEEGELIARAAGQGCGILIKKALASGHGRSEDLSFVADFPGVHSIVVGTTNPDHLRENAAAIAAS